MKLKNDANLTFYNDSKYLNLLFHRQQLLLHHCISLVILLTRLDVYGIKTLPLIPPIPFTEWILFCLLVEYYS